MAFILRHFPKAVALRANYVELTEAERTRIVCDKNVAQRF